MIQLTREEAQQVLDALVSSTGELHLRLASPTDMQLVKNHNAIQTLRARLAEPEKKQPPEQTIQQFAEKLAFEQEPLGYDAAKVLHENLNELYAKSEPEKKKLKPLCSVNGRLEHGVMCGSVLVGLKYCGHPFACKHKKEHE